MPDTYVLNLHLEYIDKRARDARYEELKQEISEKKSEIAGKIAEFGPESTEEGVWVKGDIAKSDHLDINSVTESI